MNNDDIIYTTLLFLSVFFGYLFRKLNSETAKKWVGTAVGLFIVILVSGFHTLHTLALILLTVGILKTSDKR